jgi:hypothetical protein
MKSDEELGLYDEPKEEPTIVRLPSYYETKQEIKLEEVFNDDKKENIKKFIDEIKNPSEPNQALKDSAQRYMKQETLEEAATKWVFETNSHKWSNNDDTAGDNYDSFLAGYKLAQERSYSEEEVLDMLKEVRKGSMITSSINNRTYWEFDIKSEKKWFEQFKKK